MNGALTLPLDAPAPAFPDRDAFGALVFADKPSHSALAKLHAALSALAPEAPQTERVRGLEELAAWLRSSRSVPLSPDVVPGERVQISRVRLLVLALSRVPAAQARLASTLSSTLADTQRAGLLSRLGLPTERGLWAETVDRLSRRFLPSAKNDRDLAQIVARILPGRRELALLGAMPDELLDRLIAALRTSEHDAWQPLARVRSDALALIATRVAAVGLSDPIRERSPDLPLDASPFLRLVPAVDRLRRAPAGAERDGAIAECRELSDACRALVHGVVENLESAGVSVDVVYRLELIGKSLTRLEALIATLEPASGVEHTARVKRLLVDLVDARLKDHRLTEILRDNLHLLARKIIERAGHTGEHYITSSRGEWAKMLLSAAGGGVLTTGTAALKFVIGWLKAAPFVEGVLSSINYAGSFLLMQLCGFTLATKQPSVTAAALAGTLRETAGHADLAPLVSMIARITRSQLAAAIGNVGLVIPGALAFDWYWRSRHGGEPFLSAETARYAIDSLHPTRTGTIFFAALTGVLLWSSSLAAGWLENWAVYRKLPEAIAEHGAGRFLGRRIMGWLSRAFSRNVSGFGGNVSLGVLLAMTPIAGKFFGLPLDVRHVTLSTGALTLGVSSLGSQAGTWEVIAAACGVAIIGSLNFGVSFVLALAVALRARGVDRSDRFRLLRSVIATFVRSPLQFFLPPHDPEHTPVHGPASIHPPRP